MLAIARTSQTFIGDVIYKHVHILILLSVSETSTSTSYSSGRRSHHVISLADDAVDEYNSTDQYDTVLPARESVNTTRGITDHCLDNSQKNQEEQGSGRQYENLDQKAIQEMTSRPPDIYDGLFNDVRFS